jgi:moderate conductance mechanosensitive channel
MTTGLAAIRLSLAVLCAWLWLGAVALAQDSAPAGEAAATADKLQALNQEQRTDLIARLSDAQARDLLLFYLGKTAGTEAAPTTPDALLEDVEEKGALIRRNAVTLAGRLDDIPAAFGATYSKLAGDRGFVGLLVLAIAVGLIVGVGYAAERLYARGVARFRADLKARSAADGGFLPAVLALLLDLVGIAVFIAGYVLAFLAVWHGNEARRQLTAGILVAIVAVRLTRALADFLFAPEGAGPRLIPFDQPGARYFHDYSIRVAVVGAASMITAYLIGIWSGDPYVRFALMIVAGGVFVAYFAVAVWGGRHHVARAFALASEGGADAPWGMRLIARAWAPLVIVYVVAMYVATVLAALAGIAVSALSFLMAVLVVVVGMPVADSLIGLFLSRREPAAPSATGTPRSANRVFRRAARIIILVVATLIVFHLLGVDLVAGARSTLGTWVSRVVLDVGLVVLLAYVFWELAIATIDRKLAQETVLDAHGAIDITKASRLSTLLPLFRRALQIAIVVITGLMILSSLGVRIGPLLAGAGIFGLAIGFGAQTLVKDLISGLFFLLDDAFRLNEYIEVAGVGGTVERINARSLSLRTPAGAIHTVPFGGIDTVANYSRDWAIVKMEFKVTYDTDLAKVKRIFRRIGEELSKDAELAPGFIQPFKFQGVKAMEETGITVRGKFMAVPGTQFQIRKSVFERVQKAFADEGISFAQRRVQVDLPPGLDLDEPTKDTISRAAAAALATDTPAVAKA